MRSLLVVLVMAAAVPARGTVLGGGLADTDCTVGFEGVTATAGASGVVCTDGDPACDADRIVDGTCRFAVRVCTRLAAGGCTPRDVTSIAVAGLPLDAPAPGGAPACGAADVLEVASGLTTGATVVARDGGGVVDVDYLNLCCQAVTGPFVAVSCALAIDPGVAGCAHPVPAAFTAALAKARGLVEQASTDPAHAAAAARRAAKPLRRMRAIARHLGKSDTCGFALGLVATHAQGVLQEARHALGRALRE